MPNAFASLPSREWQSVADALKNLLSTEEYASARASTPNAHYTSPEVIQAIWQAMEQFGLKPGTQILEPSVGVGHFFGMMPDTLYPGTKRTGVELDPLRASPPHCTRIRAFMRRVSKTRRFQRTSLTQRLETSRLEIIRSTIRHTAEVRT